MDAPPHPAGTHDLGDHPPPETFRILSIDGGGVRGVFAAKALVDLEEATARPLRRCFDLICGTSTGGIIALGLALGKPASEVLDLYREHGGAIFPANRKGRFKGIWRPRYGNAALREALHSAFRDRSLAEAQSRLCIPSIDIQTGKPRVFKTDHRGDEFQNDWKLTALEVGLATSAAPIFFPAAIADSDRAMIDGGLWANNPALVGIGETTLLGYKLDQIELLSVGTGSTRFTMDGVDAQRAGLLRWAPKIVDVIFQVQSQFVHNLLRPRPTGSYLPLRRYLRVDCELALNAYRLDDASKISSLTGLGHAAAVENLTAMKTFCEGEERVWKSPHAPESVA
jgi:hypothetical protein